MKRVIFFPVLFLFVVTAVNVFGALKHNTKSNYLEDSVSSDFNFLNINKVLFQAPSPDLTISKVASGGPFQQGGTVSYAITVTNGGTGPTI